MIRVVSSLLPPHFRLDDAADPRVPDDLARQLFVVPQGELHKGVGMGKVPDIVEQGGAEKGFDPLQSQVSRGIPVKRGWT